MEKSEVKSQPLINLCLGIGESSTTISEGCNKYQQKYSNVKSEFDHDDDDDDEVDHVVERVVCRESRVVNFTEEQLKELELQLIIFRYLVSGLPVPLQLLLPLWTSSSPLWIGSCSRGGYHRNMMDPEPGRCRRTDGKKWRCYQPVVPNEKYCQRHMHRGRKRSRKLVEDVTAHTPNVNDDVSKNTERQNAPGFEVPAVPDKKSQPRGSPSRVPHKAPGLTLTVTAAKIDVELETRSEGRHGMIMKGSMASGLDFSTKIVRQDSDRRCSEVQLQVNASRQLPLRCSRTDGRKWQCHNVSIPGHKYCALHIHRGLKKPLPAISPSATGATHATDPSFSTPKSSVPRQAKAGMGLDTDLNISLLDSKPDIREKETCSISSSDASTETTISDDSAYISNMITVSARMQ